MDPHSRFSSSRMGWVISRLPRSCPFVKVWIRRQRLASQGSFLPQLLVSRGFFAVCHSPLRMCREFEGKIKWDRTRLFPVLRWQADCAIICRIHCPEINSPFRASRIPQPPLLCIWPWKMKFKPSLVIVKYAGNWGYPAALRTLRWFYLNIIW